MQAVSHDLRLVEENCFLRGQRIIIVTTNKSENKPKIMQIASRTNM